MRSGSKGGVILGDTIFVVLLISNKSSYFFSWINSFTYGDSSNLGFVMLINFLSWKLITYYGPFLGIFLKLIFLAEMKFPFS